MKKRLLNATRLMLIVIPSIFIIGTVISSCGDGSGGNCDGDVGVTTVQDCTNYANDNNCDSSSFNNGVCNVQGCDNCEVIVDDVDPVIDVDDAGF